MRWLRLLRASTVPQAWALVRADSSYTDLTPTQYADALDWLTMLGFLSENTGELAVTATFTALPQDQVNQLLFARALENSAPPWLQDADILVADSSEIPQDAATLAAELGLEDHDALSAIRQVHGRIDLQLRATVGSDGELALVHLLEANWPGSTVHVSLTDDGFGYDIAFSLKGTEWHLEVKATTRRGRLVVYLSRHEHDVSLTDPHWRLVVVGLMDDHSPGAIATVDHKRLWMRTPTDVYQGSTWQSVRHQISSGDLQPGLDFIDECHLPRHPHGQLALVTGHEPEAEFAWLPRRQGRNSDA